MRFLCVVLLIISSRILFFNQIESARQSPKYILKPCRHLEVLCSAQAKKRHFAQVSQRTWSTDRPIIHRTKQFERSNQNSTPSAFDTNCKQHSRRTMYCSVYFTITSVRRGQLHGLECSKQPIRWRTLMNNASAVYLSHSPLISRRVRSDWMSNKGSRPTRVTIKVDCRDHNVHRTNASPSSGKHLSAILHCANLTLPIYATYVCTLRIDEQAYQACFGTLLQIPDHSIASLSSQIYYATASDVMYKSADRENVNNPNHTCPELKSDSDQYRSSENKTKRCQPEGTMHEKNRIKMDFAADCNLTGSAKQAQIEPDRSFDHKDRLSQTLIRRARTAKFLSESKMKHTVTYPVTFRTADAYLVVPALRLYGQFSFTFALQTSQSDGLILFSPGAFTVDFIAFELYEGHLYVIFDMGSGAQRHGLPGMRVNDKQWHKVELIRKNEEENVLNLFLDRGFLTESRLDIKVLHGERSKNFNFGDLLYIGGIPKSIGYQWRERLGNSYGFQGCLGNFSVNDQPVMDLLKAAQKLSTNQSVPLYLMNKDVVSGCLDRPLGAPHCPSNSPLSSLFDARQNKTLPRYSQDAYCMNGGHCLLMWSTLKCSCDLTSFQGTRCSQTGTTLSFGIRSRLSHLSQPDHPIRINTSQPSIGYLRLTYTDQVRNTYQEEFVLGIQTTRTGRDSDKPNERNNDDAIQTLIFITNPAQTGDYLHLYLHWGYIRVDCDFGGGPVRLRGPNLYVKDGFYHRIRGFRRNFRLVLEVDQLRSVYQLRGRYGKQFNGQETIWLGHAPNLNRTDFYQGYMSGVYYNGVLITDVAAGLTYLPFIHVTRYANVDHVNKFEAALSPASPFRSRVDHQDRAIQKDQNHPNFVADGHSVEKTTGSLNTQADAASPRSHNPVSPDVINIDDHSISNGTLGEYDRKLANSEKNGRVRGPILDQVNIWLLVCLSGAGCIMLVSLTILAYRFHFKRFLCCQTNKRARRRNKQHTVRRSSQISLPSTENLPHVVTGFQEALPCSPVAMPPTYPIMPKYSSNQACNQNLNSGSTSYNPALAFMVPSSIMSGLDHRKINPIVASTCGPVHIHTVPTSLVYLGRNSIVSSAIYQPWEQFVGQNEDRASSQSLHSTNTLPVADLVKPILISDDDDENKSPNIITNAQMCNTLGIDLCYSDTAT